MHLCRTFCVLFILSRGSAQRPHFPPPSNNSTNWATRALPSLHNLNSTLPSRRHMEIHDDFLPNFPQGTKDRKKLRHMMSDEENLLSYLFTNYNPSARPVLNSSATVFVNLKFSLLQIQELNVRNQILTSTGFLILEWKDERLIWSRGISQLDEVVVKGEDIWRPEFAIINGAESIYGEYVEFKATLRSDGSIRWEPGGIFKTMCSIDITFYPFDTQRCEIKFGAWSYHTTKMNLTTDEKNIRIDAYEKNGEWQVMNTDAQRNEFAFECCPRQRFSYVSFAVELRRRQTFYVMNVIVPGLLTSAVLLSLFYCVPSQKVHIGVAALLSFRLFLVNVADTVPRTSDHIPLLGIYLTCTMAITTLAMVATVLVGNLYERKDGPVPKWLKTIMMDHVAKILCMGDKMRADGNGNKNESTKRRERSFSWSSWCCLHGKGGKKNPEEEEEEQERSSECMREDEELKMMATYDPRNRRTDVKTHIIKSEKGKLKDGSRMNKMSRSKSFDVGSALASIAIKHVNDIWRHEEKSCAARNNPGLRSFPGSTGKMDSDSISISMRSEEADGMKVGSSRSQGGSDNKKERQKEETNDSNKNLDSRKLSRVDEEINYKLNHQVNNLSGDVGKEGEGHWWTADSSASNAPTVRHRQSPRSTATGVNEKERGSSSRRRSVETKKAEGPPNYSKDWAHLAAVCDRFFFWLCLFFILGTTLLLFHPLTTSRFFKIPVIDKT